MKIPISPHYEDSGEHRTDNWKAPDNIPFSPFVAYADSKKTITGVGVDYSYSANLNYRNSYNLMSWIDGMEASGAVFLPTDYHYFDGAGDEYKADYWTSTQLGRTSSYKISIDYDDNVNYYDGFAYSRKLNIPDYASRNNAYSVRLVQDVENSSDLTEDCTISYLAKDATTLADEDVTLRLPQAPQIDGFTFLKWLVKENDLADGINIQAVYTSDTPTSAPEVVNPANKAQKLIRHGNVYILSEGKTYSVQGQKVK